MELLIRGIFCASCLTGLNLVEVELHEQNLSVIPGHQEFGILEETGENTDDLKMVIVRLSIDTLNNLQFRALRRRNREPLQSYPILMT